LLFGKKGIKGWAGGIPTDSQDTLAVIMMSIPNNLFRDTQISLGGHNVEARQLLREAFDGTHRPLQYDIGFDPDNSPVYILNVSVTAKTEADKVGRRRLVPIDRHPAHPIIANPPMQKFLYAPRVPFLVRRFSLAPVPRLVAIPYRSSLSFPIWPPVETSRLGDISIVVTPSKGDISS
jgi:hypothetical protein